MTCAVCDPNAPLSVVRGASKTFSMSVKSGKTLVDLTGAKIWFTVKNRIEDVNNLILKRTLNAGGVDGQILVTIPQTGASLGQVQIFIDPADTACLDPDAQYVYDVWVQLLTGRRYQVSQGKFMIKPAVTTSFF